MRNVISELISVTQLLKLAVPFRQSQWCTWSQVQSNYLSSVSTPAPPPVVTNNQSEMAVVLIQAISSLGYRET